MWVVKNSYSTLANKQHPTMYIYNDGSGVYYVLRSEKNYSCMNSYRFRKSAKINGLLIWCEFHSILLLMEPENSAPVVTKKQVVLAVSWKNTDYEIFRHVFIHFENRQRMNLLREGNKIPTSKEPSTWYIICMIKREIAHRRYHMRKNIKFLALYAYAYLSPR